MNVTSLAYSRGVVPPGTSAPGFLLCVVCLVCGIWGTVHTQQPAYLAAGALVGVYLLIAVRVADQWEKAAIFRLGRYRGLRGPGLFMIVPVLDKVSKMVDQRVRVADVSAESALTRDTKMPCRGRRRRNGSGRRA